MWQEETVPGEAQSKLQTIMPISIPAPSFPRSTSTWSEEVTLPLLQGGVTADTLSLPSPDVVSRKP